MGCWMLRRRDWVQLCPLLLVPETRSCGRGSRGMTSCKVRAEEESAESGWGGVQDEDELGTTPSRRVRPPLRRAFKAPRSTVFLDPAGVHRGGGGGRPDRADQDLAPCSHASWRRRRY